MKILKSFIAIAALSLTASLQAEEPAAESVTIKGSSMCAKCELSETDSCMNVLEVTEGEKSVFYYFTKNMKHSELFCIGKKENVEVVGTVEEKDGKKWITPKSIEQKES